MRKFNFIFLLAVLGIGIASPILGAQVFEFEVSPAEVRSLDRLTVSPFISITPDKGDLATYFVGETIVLNYRSDRRGYVSIFDYLPSGKARILRNNEPISPGFERTLRGTVSEPEGTEKFLMVVTSRVIPDRLLIEAMTNPSRILEILGEDTLINQCTIQVAQRRAKSPTFIRFDRLPAEISSGSKVRLSATLTDAEGRALVNREVRWEVNQGTVDQPLTVTNSFGQVEVWFYAPSVTEPTYVYLRASFPGDHIYQESYAEIELQLIPQKIKTFLSLTPQSFHLASGESLDFEVYLEDAQGEAVADRSILWSANVGSWEKEITYTNSQGKASNRWFAPMVETSQTVELKAEFAGVRNLLPAQGFALGTVSPVQVYSGKSYYILDFSSGQVDTNFDSIFYQGDLVSGFALNPAQTLALKKGEVLELDFTLTQPVKRGALYLWGKSDSPAKITIYLNQQPIFSSPTAEGIISPLETNVIYLTDYLYLGRNRLKIEAWPEHAAGAFLIQRILIVF
ncbi:MAG: hypothetical protein PWP04_74 [Candidatus Atribacteria bacterium]|nr:hypothetical protein [Candidatus Atribacteria bacterium]